MLRVVIRAENCSCAFGIQKAVSMDLMQPLVYSIKQRILQSSHS